MLGSSKPDQEERMSSNFDPAGSPFLNGIFAPTQSELDETPVAVISGAVPADLDGTYYRNGPNSRFAPLGSYTFPLDGDGMLHAVHFRAGRATYRNRYVRTPSMAAEERAGRALWGGVATPIMPSAEQVGPELATCYKDLPDINVVRHAGRLLALAESARPFEMTDVLDTVGPCYFGGKLPKGITAHPKIDPITGELVVFRYDLMAPFLTWAIIGANGNVTRCEEPIEIDSSYMIHDFVITSRFIVLFVCPARLDKNAAQVLSWQPERGTRIAIITRDGSSPPRWIATEAFWVWHFANGFEEVDERGATTIVVDYPHWTSLSLGSAQPDNRGGITRARLDPVAGTARFETVDDQLSEFPRIDDRRMGQPNRYFHALSKEAGLGRGMWNILRRFDRTTGGVAMRSFGATSVGEAVFAPSAKDGSEDEGYLLTYGFDGDVSRLFLLHASDISGEPAAVLRLPQRVPTGLHGCWVPRR